MAAYLVLLLWARASKKPTKVTEVRPGYGKSGACALVGGILGWGVVGLVPGVLCLHLVYTRMTALLMLLLFPPRLKEEYGGNRR